MNYRRISYRYAGQAHELEPRPLGDMLRSRLPGRLARPHWRPPADLFESSQALFVKVELAGVAEKDVQVLLYEDALVIEGERAWRLPEGVARFLAVEIPYGPFRLEVSLPEGLELEGAEARCEDGFLLVRLPRRKATG